MKKTVFAVFAITVLAGCNHTAKEDTPAPQLKIKPVEAVEEKAVSEETMPESEYKTFTSEDCGFSVDIPISWKTSKPGQGCSHYFGANKDDGTLLPSLSVIVEGSEYYDVGDDVISENTTLGGLPAVVSKADKNSLPFIANVTENYPVGWTPDNDIVFSFIDNPKTHQHIFDSFEFIK